MVETFGKWLKHQRSGRGLTQAQLAQKLGCATITLRKIESEERRPSRQIVERLSEFFNISPTEQADFLKFARGDWTKAPSPGVIDTPWSISAFSSKPANNIPLQLTTFIGREKEIAEIKETINRHRLVTLIGSGGTGKTRLSLKVAEGMREQFPYMWFVELAPITDQANIAPAVLSVMGLAEQPGSSIQEIIIRHIQGQDTLIILDNCEHLIEESAQISYSLLNRAPRLRILASSREALGITGELAWHVPSLSLPDIDHLPEVNELLHYEAIQLFLERAALATSNFALTKENASFIAKICSRLDGIPLAIELAASRTRTLSVQEIATRLDDRFQLLTGGSRTALPRQQTLRATIDWSYNLLTEPEQMMLRQLSVFSGGWTLEAAEAVCGPGGNSFDILDLLTQLVNKTLVNQQHARYHMLESTRQYAREKLSDSGEMNIVCLRHLDFFAKTAAEAERSFKGQNQSLWYSRLDNELDNLRAALTWGIGNENVETQLRLAAGLWRYWKNRGHSSEGRGYLQRILDGLPPGTARQTSACARALTAAGSLAYYEGDISYSEQTRTEALSIFRELDDKVGIADCLNGLGNTALSQGNYDASRALYEESLLIRKELGDTWGVARLLGNLGLLAYFQFDYAQSHSLHLESLALFKELQDDEGVVNELVNLGDIFHAQRELSAADSFYRESTTIARRLKDQWGLAYAIKGLADVAFEQGDFSTASSHYEECLVLFQKGADYAGLPFALESVAALARAKNQLEKAARIFGAADALRKRTHTPLPPPNQNTHQMNLSILQQQLDPATFAMAWMEGSAMTIDQAITYALEK